MNKTKAYLGCLGNFLLGTLGVVGVGWFIIYKFPKSINTVYTVGGILVLMCLYSAFDEMNKKLKRTKKINDPIDIKAINDESKGNEPTQSEIKQTDQK